MQKLKINKIRKMKWYILLLAFSFVYQHDAILSAADFAGASLLPDSMISKGNRHYMNREYELAADCYKQVIAMGYISGELYYNLGNTCYKQDSLSKAILYFEKALLLKPGDEDIIQNLALANTRIIDKIDTIPDFFLHRWMRNFQLLFLPLQWAVISLVLFILALNAILWVVISNNYSIKRIGLTLGVIFLVLSIFGMISMRNRTNKLLSSGSAVIMQPSVNARSSPDDQSTNMFVLHEGTKVLLLDSVQNWKEIRIPDGNKGWVPDDVLEEI
jgi:tetratricopeptide (TPR) repeat protein